MTFALIYDCKGSFRRVILARKKLACALVAYLVFPVSFTLGIPGNEKLRGHLTIADTLAQTLSRRMLGRGRHAHLRSLCSSVDGNSNGGTLLVPHLAA
jgi:hypothetical protein